MFLDINVDMYVVQMSKPAQRTQGATAAKCLTSELMQGAVCAYRRALENGGEELTKARTHGRVQLPSGDRDSLGYITKAHRYARRASDSPSSSKSLPESADSLPAEISRGLSPDPQGLELPTFVSRHVVAGN